MASPPFQTLVIAISKRFSTMSPGTRQDGVPAFPNTRHCHLQKIFDDVPGTPIRRLVFLPPPSPHKQVPASLAVAVSSLPLYRPCVLDRQTEPCASETSRRPTVGALHRRCGTVVRHRGDFWSDSPSYSTPQTGLRIRSAVLSAGLHCNRKEWEMPSGADSPQSAQVARSAATFKVADSRSQVEQLLKLKTLNFKSMYEIVPMRSVPSSS
ncbi:hypothetical protein GGX14DRAFT_576774 [Mycena pura]|uniref:Uncharacterized protein n=1 Tax=Mycena pura TaxID=153505 RepID=A0AAD6UWQ9_9AGAR|nr:hypothetical protein GGX14DRAFT_576774 [Mycena pura]